MRKNTSTTKFHHPLEITAHSIARRFVEILRQQKRAGEFNVSEDVIIKTLRTLGGISQAINATLPRYLRKHGQARYRIDCKDEDVFGKWEGVGGESLDILSIALNNAGLMGDFKAEEAMVFSAAFCDKLFDSSKGTVFLSDMRVKEVAKSTVWLEWKREESIGS